MTSAPRPLLAGTHLSKSYGPVRVLEDVEFDVAAGEVHALVGENGAGKSTLIKILGGAVVPDAGTVRLDGQLVPAGDPRVVRRLGSSVVYQEFTLVPDLSVADNIFLGRERGAPWLRRREMAQAVRAGLADLGVSIDPAALVRTLSVAHQQLVEIARALVADARVVILDEPSASLSGREVDRLLTVVRHLRDRGLGVVFVSHRFEEIFAIADRVTVLRDGRRVASAPVTSFDRAALIRAMVGRDVSEEFPQRSIAPGPVVLAVHGLAAAGRFDDVSFTVRRGEVVGLAGLVGAGRSSAGLAIAGALRATGTATLEGTPVRFASPAAALSRGVAYVTEDRKGHGIVPAMTMRENITLAALASLTTGGFISAAREHAAAQASARTFDVRGALEQPAATLSGGNQQKAMVARFVMTRPKVLILDEPTRGVDVGARAEIYALMNRLAGEGLAIVLISSDLPEVIGMSDRVVVIRDGRVSGELARGAATPEAVMALATGA